MSLAHKYRHQFAAYRGDRLLFCFATATALHVTIAVLGAALWQPQPKPDPKAEQEISSVQVDFVYLDQKATEPPKTAERQAVINSVAGGEHKPELPVNGGKPGLNTAITAIASASITKPTAATPPPVTGTIVPTRVTNTKAIEPQPVSKPAHPSTASRATPSAPSAPAIPTVQSADPTVVLDATSEPANLTSQLSGETAPNSTTSIPASIPATPSPMPSELPPQAGHGLDGFVNPDQTAPGENRLNATQDPIWGEYINSASRAIYEHWQQIDLDFTRNVVVQFTINRAGELVNATVTQPSGLDGADQAALKAVEDAAPFAPFPAATTDSLLTINFTFNYHQRNVDRCTPDGTVSCNSTDPTESGL